MSGYPSRIVCLTEETTETLYLLGEEHRIVGISGFTVRPARARKEKPRVSAFTSANIDKILALQPDLVLGFSDLQAGIATDLIRHGVAVHIFNQRSVDEILTMVRMLGGLIGCEAKASVLAESLAANIAQVRTESAMTDRRPRVYFEEWNDPLISGIRWVSELIEIAGGADCFPELGAQSLARNRILADPSEVARRAPDIIVGSWCGKKFRPEEVIVREAWGNIPAVIHGDVYEIKSPLILQPGPAALTDGLAELRSIVLRWQQGEMNRENSHVLNAALGG
ncbi:MAG TPA: cobalamin-binding protein [Steroidobacteraceae bacterium]|nr:cobalamin-binding protein [Steroidobacteraceae bacterium]